jgi:hypothetical protein
MHDRVSRNYRLSGHFSFGLAIRLFKAHISYLMDKSTEQDRLVRYLNVERYRRLLRYATDEDRRQHLQELIAEEQQKQKEAGDPKHPY